MINLIIPQLVYHFDIEYFEMAGDDIKIIENKTTIYKHNRNKTWNNTTYCHQWIDSTKSIMVKWTFKIIEQIETICFGIVSNNKHPNKDCSDDNHIPNYIHCSAGTLFANGRIVDNLDDVMADVLDDDVDVIPGILKYNQGNIIKYKLDLCKGIFYGKKNDENYVELLNDIKKGDNIRYKMAISIYSVKTRVSIIDFTINQIENK